MEYFVAILFFISGVLFFSGIKITNIGEDVMNLQITDPTVLWAAVGAIIVGIISAIFILYRENKHTKEILDTSNIIRTGIGVGTVTLQENDHMTHVKLDSIKEKSLNLDADMKTGLSELNRDLKTGFSEIRHYISDQRMMLDHVHDSKITTGELLAHIEHISVRAAEVESLKRDQVTLQNKNEKLMNIISKQAQTITDMKSQIKDLTQKLDQKEASIYNLKSSSAEKSKEDPYEEER